MIWLGLVLGTAYLAWIPLTCWVIDKIPYGMFSDTAIGLIASLIVIVAALLFSGSLFAMGLSPNEWVGSASLLAGSLGYAAGFRLITNWWWD